MSPSGGGLRGRKSMHLPLPPPKEGVFVPLRRGIKGEEADTPPPAPSRRGGFTARSAAEPQRAP